MPTVRSGSMIFEFEGETPEYAKTESRDAEPKVSPKMDERNVSMIVEPGKTFALPGGQGHGTGGSKDGKGTEFLATESEAEHLSKVGLAKRGGKAKPVKEDEPEAEKRETKVVGPTAHKAEAVTTESAHSAAKRK